MFIKYGLNPVDTRPLVCPYINKTAAGEIALKLRSQTIPSLVLFDVILLWLFL